jgi:outer membrane protein OmpA-like peptidoglycan-associated protein
MNAAALRSPGTLALLLLGGADLLFLNGWVFPRAFHRPPATFTSLARPRGAPPAVAVALPAPRVLPGEAAPADRPVLPAGAARFETRRTYFARNARLLDRPGKQAVNALAAKARQRPSAVIIVNGHTDETGPDAYNDWLSRERANAVADRLAAVGVARERIFVHHFGASRPAVTGDGPRAWRRNRRVEVVLIDEGRPGGPQVGQPGVQP